MKAWGLNVGELGNPPRSITAEGGPPGLREGLPTAIVPGVPTAVVVGLVSAAIATLVTEIYCHLSLIHI